MVGFFMKNKRDCFPYENAMNVIKLLKRLLANDRRALSAPILALILVIVGIALALVAASIAGGFLFGFGASPKVTIERVDVLVEPISGTGYVTIDIRNSGGAPLTDCIVEEVTGAGYTTSNAAAVNLNPGQSTTETGTIGTAQSGQVYVFRVECRGPGGAPVQDQKSAVAHI
jgi:uncharacterized protein (DUF58 family)